MEAAVEAAVEAAIRGRERRARRQQLSGRAEASTTLLMIAARLRTHLSVPLTSRHMLARSGGGVDRAEGCALAASLFGVVGSRVLFSGVCSLPHYVACVSLSTAKQSKQFQGVRTANHATRPP